MAKTTQPENEKTVVDKSTPDEIVKAHEAAQARFAELKGKRQQKGKEFFSKTYELNVVKSYQISSAGKLNDTQGKHLVSVLTAGPAKYAK